MAELPEIKVTTVDYMKRGERTVALAGKTTVDRYADPSSELKESFDPDVLIPRIVKLRHGSVIEHAVMTFYIKNVPRSFTHQLVRHRIASYTQSSQQYIDYSMTEEMKTLSKEEREELGIPDYVEVIHHAPGIDEVFITHPNEDIKFPFVTPPYFKTNEEDYAKHIEHMRRCDETYHYFMDRGYPPGISRNELAECAGSNIVMTINARSLDNVMNLRCCNREEWPSNTVARMFYIESLKTYPVLFGKKDLGLPNCLKKGMSCTEGYKACTKFGVKIEDIRDLFQKLKEFAEKHKDDKDSLDNTYTLEYQMYKEIPETWWSPMQWKHTLKDIIKNPFAEKVEGRQVA